MRQCAGGACASAASMTESAIPDFFQSRISSAVSAALTGLLLTYATRTSAPTPSRMSTRIFALSSGGAIPDATGAVGADFALGAADEAALGVCVAHGRHEATPVDVGCSVESASSDAASHA